MAGFYCGQLDHKLRKLREDAATQRLLVRQDMSAEIFDNEYTKLMEVGQLSFDTYSLAPYVRRIRSFVKALRLSGCKEEHETAIWVVVIEVLQATILNKDKRTQALKQIKDFELKLPLFDHPENVYKSVNSELRLALANLFKAVLDFHIELLRVIQKNVPKLFSGKRGQSSELDIAKTEIFVSGKTFMEFSSKVDLELRNTEESSLTIPLLQSSAAQIVSASISTSQHLAEAQLPTSPAGTAHQASEAQSMRSFSGLKPRLDSRRLVNVPSVNKDFFGRDDKLREIHECLNPINRGNDIDEETLANAQPISCIIHGMGGVGKTQTATQYAWKYAASYDWVFWVRAESETDLLKSYHTIGQKVGIIASHEDPGAGAMETVQEWLESTDQRWLIIFDNVDTWDESVDMEDDDINTWDDVSRFWPRVASRSSAIIITIQKAAEDLPWSDNKVELQPFDNSTAKSYLLGRPDAGFTNEQQRNEKADEILQYIGTLPLYLVQAAGFIKQSRCSFGEYLEELRGAPGLPQLSLPPRSRKFGKPINAAFDTALRRLDDDARDLVYTLAFLDPEGVPEKMLFSKTRDSKTPFFREDHRVDLIAQLHDVHLVDRVDKAEGYCLCIHRSLQLAMRDKLDKLDKANAPAGNVRKSIFKRASLLLTAVLPPPSALHQPNWETWTVLSKYLRQIQSLESCYRKGDAEDKDSFELANLFSKFGIDLYDQGLIKIGEKLLKTARSILPESERSDILELRANIDYILGMYTDTLGITRRDEGLKLREAVLKIRQKLFDEKVANIEAKQKLSQERAPKNPLIDDDILLHNAVMDRACSSQQFNQFDIVEELANRCHERYKTWGTITEYPYEYAKYFHAMSFLFVYRRQTNLAVQFAKTGADLMAIAAKDTLIATVYRFDYAICLYQNGQKAQAIQTQRAILETRITKCGKSNALTLQSYLILSIMNYLSKEYELAESWIREVLLNAPKAYWPDENVARAKYYMSRILRAHDPQTDVAPPNASFTSAWTDEVRQRTLANCKRVELADIFLSEAEQVLDKLVPRERRESLINETLDRELIEALYYDYMAPWGYRIIVPQTPDYEAILNNVPISSRGRSSPA